MKTKKKIGLTFIELMLAISLFSVIGTILYSVLFQGVRAWNREERDDQESGEERIIIKQLGNSFRNAFIHTWVNFLGESDQIYFCGLMDFKNQSHLRIKQLSKIHYYFLKKNRGNLKKGLYLARYPIEYVFQDSPPQGVLISNAFSDLTFEYGYWDSTEKTIITKPEWQDREKIPKYMVIKGKSSKTFIAAFVNPLGELPKIEEKNIER